MKAAIRLEISKKDENELRTKLNELLNLNAIDPTEHEEIVQDIIVHYRTQLHTAFKMGLRYNPNKEEE